jgi:hypothetical protein
MGILRGDEGLLWGEMREEAGFMSFKECYDMRRFIIS